MYFDTWSVVHVELEGHRQGKAHWPIDDDCSGLALHTIARAIGGGYMLSEPSEAERRDCD